MCGADSGCHAERLTCTGHTDDVTGIAYSPENLRLWVADPQQIKPGCLMPAFGLSDRERNDIVRYLLTLR